MRNALASEYGSVAALNAAWGANYTSFDSSGTCVGNQPIACASSVSADNVGTGDGSTLTFSYTLSQTIISRFSAQILVSGIPVAGDDGNGNLYGPNIASGAIDYSSGALSITFVGGQAPANGQAITATYIANGWGIGTGFLDEDDRTSHQSWIGNDWIAMSNAGAATVADLMESYQAIAAQYFSTCRTFLKAAYPNILYLGPDALGTWSVPSAAPVLRAAGQYVDAFITSNNLVFTQTEMDFIESNYGDKPYFGSFYSAANPDSALAAYPNPIGAGFSNQTTRGSTYYDMVQAQQTSRTTAGDYPYIGTYWWEYVDNWEEQINWGLVTDLDNAYDAYEATAGPSTCAAPLQSYVCGGESAPGSGAVLPFGNLVTWVTSANTLWLELQFSPASPPVADITPRDLARKR
jgi:hypothetical protein